MQRFSPRLLSLACMAALLAAGPASAADFAPDGYHVQLGVAHHTTSALAGLRWNIGRTWHKLGGDISAAWELGLGHWRTTEPGRPDANVTQLVVTPVFRYQTDGAARWFAEAGIGLSFTAPVYRTSGKHFSTSFNFADHLGVGWRLGASHELSLRFQHFSNGGISHPNPGENFWQLRYSSRFE